MLEGRKSTYKARMHDRLFRVVGRVLEGIGAEYEIVDEGVRINMTQLGVEDNKLLNDIMKELSPPMESQMDCNNGINFRVERDVYGGISVLYDYPEIGRRAEVRSDGETERVYCTMYDGTELLVNTEMRAVRLRYVEINEYRADYICLIGYSSSRTDKEKRYKRKISSRNRWF